MPAKIEDEAKKKSERLVLYHEPAKVQQFRSLAAVAGKSVSSLLCELMDEYIEENSEILDEVNKVRAKMRRSR